MQTHPMTLAEFTGRLRDRIVAALHQGQLQAGDRLPSIRELSREYGQDHRAVARAYRALEAEGLVEVRTRSGVYVARQERVGGEMLAETARWMAGVLTEGWKRRIPVPLLFEQFRRSTTSVSLRCACVDSTEDGLTAICSELQDEFGLDTQPIPVKIMADLHAEGGGALEGLPAELRDADLIVTTDFHAGPAGAVAEALGKRLVVLGVNPEIESVLEARLRTGRLTVVCVDPEFGEQVRALYDGAYRESVRVVQADDAPAVAAVDPAEPVLVTRAAHRRLAGVPLMPLVAHAPTLTAETVHTLSEIIIRTNLEALHGA